MSSRKEQKEALKRERLAKEQAAAQAAARKRLIGIVVASILVLGIIGALLAVVLAGGDDDGTTSGGGPGSTAASVSYPDGGEIPAQKEADLAVAMKAAGCTDETIVDHPYDDPKGIHTADPDEVIQVQVGAAGARPPLPGADRGRDLRGRAPDHAHVHALEHGRILIWLRPDLTSDQLAQFKALYEEDPYHVIMVPRAELKQPFAVIGVGGRHHRPHPALQGREREHLGRDPRVQGEVPGQGARVRPITSKPAAKWRNRSRVVRIGADVVVFRSECCASSSEQPPRSSWAPPSRLPHRP